MSQNNISALFNNPSGVCYVKPEQPTVKIEYREPPFTLDSRNRILFKGQLYLWRENIFGDKYGFDDAGFRLNALNDAYKFGVEDSRR